jgi:hypothetical protein
MYPNTLRRVFSASLRQLNRDASILEEKRFDLQRNLCSMKKDIAQSCKEIFFENSRNDHLIDSPKNLNNGSIQDCVVCKSEHIRKLSYFCNGTSQY